MSNLGPKVEFCAWKTAFWGNEANFWLFWKLNYNIWVFCFPPFVKKRNQSEQNHPNGKNNHRIPNYGIAKVKINNEFNFSIHLIAVLTRQ